MTLLHPIPDPKRQKVLVLGAGEVGFNVSQRLAKENWQVVIVDSDADRVLAVQDALDVQAVLGSASSPAILDQAGVAEAGIVVAVTSVDEVNLVACLLANLKNPKAIKLARVRNEEFAGMQGLLAPDALNIKAIINPDAEVVDTILHMLSVPKALDYGEFAGGRIKVLALEVHSGPLVGEPLTRFKEIVQDQGIRVGGILRGDRLVLPSGDDVINAGEVVYFVCFEESLAKILAVTESRSRPVRNICIVGGGDMGLRLARRLDNRNYRVKLVERKTERCAVLADRLTNVAVLNGDGADRNYMAEENIGDMDMVIALTGAEETNILVCLLAKSLGTPNTITRVNKHDYMPIVRAIGIKLCVNPRLAATNSIVRFLRSGLLLSTLTTHDEDMEMLEAVVRNGSPLVGKSLREMRLPRGINLLVAMRWDELFIPRGDTVLQAGDRVIVVCERARLPEMDGYLDGK